MLRLHSIIKLKLLVCTTIAVTNLACTKTPPALEPISHRNESAQSDTALRPHSQPAPGRIVSQSAVENANPATSSPTEAISRTDTPQSSPGTSSLPVMDDCDTTIAVHETNSVFLPENKVVITRIMSPCVSSTGQIGHKKNAGWMAMGFPCTGGEGRIDWKGTNHNRPKMVSFLMETSCAMSPSDTRHIRSEAAKFAKIPESAPLIAFNPFVIQYWEIPGYDDADVSFTVDLRSGSALDDAWTKFIKGKPIKVFLIGRENAWVPGNKMYAVEGEISFVSKNRFAFKVAKANLIAGAELEKVKTRCESLRPERDCSRVF